MVTIRGTGPPDAQGRMRPNCTSTAASRPWFDDMSTAQSPADAARRPVELALASEFDAGCDGAIQRVRA